MGKGSKRRPISVPLAKFKANWDRIFKRIITTKEETMLVLYTEKQLKRAYKIFVEDYEGTIVPDLEAFRILFEVSEELQELAGQEEVIKMDFSGAFETDIESCGRTPEGFIPKDTSIH